MSIVVNFPTSATLAGAMEINRMHRQAKENDLGFKHEKLISAVNALGSAVSSMHIALGSAAASLAGASLFSAFSGYAGTANPGTVSTFSLLSNFAA